MDSNEPIVFPCFLYCNSFSHKYLYVGVSGVSKKLPTLEKMRKGMSVCYWYRWEHLSLNIHKKNSSKPSPSPTTDVQATAATKTENTHLSFSDSFRLGLHEFFFCGEVRSVARAHVLIYKENSNIILSPLGIT